MTQAVRHSLSLGNTVVPAVFRRECTCVTVAIARHLYERVCVRHLHSVQQTTTTTIMYLLIHTMTVTQTDCIMEAQFFHALNSTISSVQLVAKRIRVRLHPQLNSNKLHLHGPNLKTIAKRKHSHIKHHIRTIKIVSPNRPTEYVQKIDECVSTVPNPNQPALPRCSNVVTPDVPVADANRPTISITADSTVPETAQWLAANRFNMYLQTFTGFSGADMLRMSKDDLVQICGQADGIRLFNCLHSKSIAPKLTVYVCRENSNVFHAIYLSAYSSAELAQKLATLIGVAAEQVRNIYCQGPHGIHVLMNDDVIRHVKDEAMFSVDIVQDSNGFVVVLKPVVK